MRWVSLDVFRGCAIALMIVVNTVSLAAPNVYPILSHADWDGFTLADWVFPAFLFAMGLAMPLSFAKYIESPGVPGALYVRILRRFLILFGLGLLLNGFWRYDWQMLRWMGVLQRISLAYLGMALIGLHLAPKRQWMLFVGLLVGYWVCLTQLPFPGDGGALTRIDNVGAFIDRLIIPQAHLYQGDGYQGRGDPEGLFSTLGAIASVMGGYFTGQWVTRQPRQDRVLWGLVCAAIATLGIGWIWGFSFPINKKLWTSSYVLFSMGWSLLVYAVCYVALELKQQYRWGYPWQLLGRNAIALFVLSVLGLKLSATLKVGTGDQAISVYDWVYRHGFSSWAGAEAGSFLFAIATLLFWWGIAYLFHCQRWYWKV